MKRPKGRRKGLGITGSQGGGERGKGGHKGTWKSGG